LNASSFALRVTGFSGICDLFAVRTTAWDTARQVAAL
jgi:hypothetical protein